MCDECGLWCHSFCEGFSVAEELALQECLKCSRTVSGTKDLFDYITNKSTKVLEDEDDLKIWTVKLDGKM